MSDRTDEIKADLAATVDYLVDRVAEESDSFDFEELVEVEDAVAAAAKACRDAIGLLKTAQLNQLEASGSRQVGRRVFMRVPKRVERYDHAEISKAIRGLALERALDKATGEINPARVAELAVQMVGSMYVSPSSTAKKTVIDSLGIVRKTVIRRESVGYEIKIEDLDGDDDEDV